MPAKFKNRGGLFISLLCCLLFPISLISQTSLSGSVRNSDDQPVPFANVLLMSASDSILIKGGLADESGNFLIDGVANGNYWLSVSSGGYIAFSGSAFTVNSSVSQVDIPQITLASKDVTLEEVDITAERPFYEIMPDRLVVNVQNSPTAAGNTVLEVIERSPGVIVDRRRNNISMAGKSDVVIIINGKQNRMPLDAAMQLLDGMSSTNVEKLEFITTPPSSFDAEGNAGFINVVLKKNDNYGMNGSFSLMGGYGYYEKGSAALNVNYRNNKINIYGDYSFNHDHSWQLFTIVRKALLESELHFTDTENERGTITDLQNGRLGFDYEVNSNTIIGGVVSGFQRYFTMDSDNYTGYFIDGGNTGSLTGNSDEINRWRNLFANLNLTQQLGNSMKLSINADYARLYNFNPSNYQNELTDESQGTNEIQELRVSKDTPIDIYVGKVDLTGNLGEKFSFETGLKSTLNFLTNDVVVDELIGNEWQNIEVFTQNNTLREDIYGAYFLTKGNLSPKIQLSAGIRYEYTSTYLSSPTEEGIVDRKYGNLFPTFSLGYKINEVSQFTFAYNRRISRPTYNQIAPFVIFFDPETFVAGNPGLLPGITDGINMNIRWKTLFVSTGYSHTQNSIARFQPRLIPGTNQMLMASENLKSVDRINIAISLPAKVNDWWQMQNSVSGNSTWLVADYTGESFRLKQSTFRLNTSHTFLLPGNFSFETSAFYQSRTLFFGTFLMDPLWALNFGLQKKFEKIDATLTLNANDVFNQNKWQGVVDIPELNIYSEEKFHFETRVVRLTFNKRFGNQKVKATRKRTTGSDELRSRIE